MSSEIFQKVVTKETVAALGTDMTQWTDDDQAHLYEGMILACKENPDWTEEEVKAECKRQVELILYKNFRDEYEVLLVYVDEYRTTRDFYKEYKTRGRKGFHQFLGERLEFKDFCEYFYEELRERYNICSAGMEEAYERMKKNNWSFQDFAKDLKARRR
jgi:hypothetical protein